MTLTINFVIKVEGLNCVYIDFQISEKLLDSISDNIIFEIKDLWIQILEFYSQAL